MSRSRRKFVVDQSAQPTLFDIADIEPGSLDETSIVKAAMSEAIRKSPYKRLEIAFRMSTYLGYVVTEPVLDQLTSSKEEWQLKAGQINAFCRSVGNLVLYERLLESEGRRLLEPDDEAALRLGRAVQRKQDAERDILEAQRDLTKGDRR